MRNLKMSKHPGILIEGCPSTFYLLLLNHFSLRNNNSNNNNSNKYEYKTRLYLMTGCLSPCLQAFLWSRVDLLRSLGPSSTAKSGSWSASESPQDVDRSRQQNRTKNAIRHNILQICVSLSDDTELFVTKSTAQPCFVSSISANLCYSSRTSRKTQRPEAEAPHEGDGGLRN